MSICASLHDALLRQKMRLTGQRAHPLELPCTSGRPEARLDVQVRPGLGSMAGRLPQRLQVLQPLPVAFLVLSAALLHAGETVSATDLSPGFQIPSLSDSQL